MNRRLQQLVASLLLLGFVLLQVPASQGRTMGKARGLCSARCACCMKPATRDESRGSTPVAVTRDASHDPLALVPVLVALVSCAEPQEAGAFLVPLRSTVSAGPPLYTRHCSLLI